MTTGMRMAWTLDGHGWANCTVEDRQTKVEPTASYITSAPEELLTNGVDCGSADLLGEGADHAAGPGVDEAVRAGQGAWLVLVQQQIGLHLRDQCLPFRVSQLKSLKLSSS
ncbi:hypothetical protein ACFY0G_42385 [Streptomyces sp. NPDC001552]|uniref:hypothetical protein n=1 Tax=Streptomyces sp. NPDC001552 TaxID=3364587 RepID=UPI0036A01CC9